MKTPPIAPKRPWQHRLHSDVRNDPWMWLNQKNDPDVIAYLEDENTWCEQNTEHTHELRTNLYEDMLGRIQETDLSAPYARDGWMYFSKTTKGLDYPVYGRFRKGHEDTRQTLLDVNALAEGHDYFSLGVMSVSPDGKRLAWSTDTDGSERYTLFISDIESGAVTEHPVPDTYYGFAWANDNHTFFYTTIDDSHRPFRVYRHVAGKPAKDAVLVWEESDEAFYLDVSRTLSGDFILFEADSKVTSEVRFVSANTPTDTPIAIEPRRYGVEYSIDHHEDVFLVCTNDSAPNFRLCTAPVSNPAKQNWVTVIEHRDDVTLMDVGAFSEFWVIHEQYNGLPRVRIRNTASAEFHEVSFPEAVFDVFEGVNAEYDTDVWRFHYTSLVTPGTIYEYNMRTHERTVLKQTPVLGDYTAAEYHSERVWAEASDGTRIPVSLVHRADLDRSVPQPMIMTGYGSYGSSYPVSFSTTRLALLDRGIIYAIAHVRGGQEMGRQWYEDGKLLNKANTFSDFIASAQYLVDRGYTRPAQLGIIGGSAGGLLVGAVINTAPELFGAAVAQVPFVDVLTTILDTSLPLSRMEWDEWGDPNDPAFYACMKSYSPYDNVQETRYPPMLVTAGLNDPRVSYWEPAKWVARMRDTNPQGQTLLLRTNMGAGHGGASGRYGQLEETAFEYAFLVDHITG